MDHWKHKNSLFFRVEFVCVKDVSLDAIFGYVTYGQLGPILTQLGGYLALP